MGYYVIVEVKEIRQSNPVYNPDTYAITLDYYWMPSSGIAPDPVDWLYDETTIVNATDPYGLNPPLRQWMLDNPDFPIIPWVDE
jgi:hypothetical protein